jgi:hypothetical protein
MALEYWIVRFLVAVSPASLPAAWLSKLFDMLLSC